MGSEMCIRDSNKTMRFNCNDIEIIMDGLNDYRGLCEYDEESWEKITKVMDKVRLYSDQVLDCKI